VDAADLLHGHIGGMDVLARGLLGAVALIEDGTMDKFVTDRYAGWKAGFGSDALSGRLGLAEVADIAVNRALAPQPKSGRQEFLENLVNRHC
jgi:xylose isomerase